MGLMDTLQNLPPTVCILIWMFLGYSMILFNKVVLTNTSFKYPFFLTAWHMLFATVVTQYMKRTTNLLKSVDDKIELINKGYYTTIVPMGTLFATSICLGNSAYPLLSLSYIQIVKSLVPLPTLLLAFLVGREPLSVIQILLVLIIISGVVGASRNEGDFNIIGFLYQLCAMFTDSFRMTIMDMFLCDLKLDPLSLLSLMAPVSLVFISIAFVYFELPYMDFSIFSPSLVSILFLNGCLSFILNFAVILVIKRNSAVIMSIAGITKDMLLVASSALIFGNAVTIQQGLFYAMSIFGVFMHKLYKSGELYEYFGRIFSFLDNIFHLDRLVESDKKLLKNFLFGDEVKHHEIDSVSSADPKNSTMYNSHHNAHISSTNNI